MLLVVLSLQVEMAERQVGRKVSGSWGTGSLSRPRLTADIAYVVCLGPGSPLALENCFKDQVTGNCT